jgi:hypothetical protein
MTWMQQFLLVMCSIGCTFNYLLKMAERRLSVVYDICALIKERDYKKIYMVWFGYDLSPGLDTTCIDLVRSGREVFSVFQPRWPGNRTGQDSTLSLVHLF